MSRATLWACALVVIGFLLFPVLLIVPVSFTDSFFLEFPPQGLSTRWYQEVWQDPEWRAALYRSFVVGMTAVAVATPIGTMAAFSLVRGRYPGKNLLRLLILMPLIVPVIVLAVGLYDVYSNLGLIDSMVGLGLAHAALGLPFVTLVMSAAVHNLDPRLEQAARTLGASRLQAWRRVALPLLSGSLAVSALLVFITSFDEVVIAIFLTLGNKTLPARMFELLRTSISPAIAAVSSILLLTVLVGFAAVLIARVVRIRAGQAA